MIIIEHSLQNYHIDGLAQDCSISIALAMEILQFCTNQIISNTLTMEMG